MSIVRVHGHTKDYPVDGKIILDSSEILYAHEIRKEKTFIYVKHNTVEKGGEQTPLWIVCDESANDLIKQIESKEKQIEQRTGKWINRHWHGENTKECSVCHVTQSVTVFDGKVMYKYCPYCGAKMEGDAE